ncbi:PAS domain-containing protein [Desulfobotulus sp.]|uniref:PAS domain-containing protein n=1 Tax=Desulfobotulus sp. TaxID=1940337 RepID=UPI002A36A774|nr:PAS domain-containing protein [Desulfobotulus sp.]MDY0163926.1 PAS domain-containing protein [Desulfobotulus sp.]
MMDAGTVFLKSPILMWGFSAFVLWVSVIFILYQRRRIQEKEELFNALWQVTSDIFVLKDLHSRYLDTTPNFFTRLGIPAVDPVGKTDADFFDAQRARAFRAEDEEVIRSGNSRMYERSFRGPHGRVWFETLKTPVKDKKGHIRGILCVARDVTSEKRMERLLEARMRISDRAFCTELPELFQDVLQEAENLTESSLAFFHFVEGNKIRLCAWSENARTLCRVSGHDTVCDIEDTGIWTDCIRKGRAVIHNEFNATPGRRGMPPGHPEIVRELVVPVMAGERVVAVLGVGNRPFAYEDRDAEIIQALGDMTWDIVLRQRTREKWRETRRILDNLFQYFPGMVFRAHGGAFRTLAAASEGCLRLTGYAPEALVNNRALAYGDLIHPEDLESWARVTERVFCSGQAYEHIYRIRHKNGEWRWVWERGIGVVAPGHGESFIEGFITDITESRHMQEKLKEQTHVFAAIFEGISDMLVVLKPDYRVMALNRVGCEWLKREFKEVVGRRCFEVLGREGVCADCAVQKALESGESQSVDRYDPDLDRWLRVNAFPIRDETGEITSILEHVQDITKIVIQEARLAQAQKMEAIGALAGGIAHDFNNLIFPLMGYADMLREELPQDSLFQEYVEEILTAARRGRELVRQILAFSRQTTREKSLVYLQHLLKEIRMLLRAALPSTIELRFVVDEQCPGVMADVSQMHQLVMNLVTNGFQSMEKKGGVLEVTLGRWQPSCKGRRPGGHGAWVMLRVSDTGEGIPPEVLDKIFDPYFTTKERGKGTGLGLALVHSIVEAHGGSIDVKSRPGEGAVFEIGLPAMESGETSSGPEKALPEEVKKGKNERILIVDDERVLAQMMAAILEKQGYRVLYSSSAAEALDLFRKDPDFFHLVLTDLTMPEMTGVVFCRKIKEIRMNIPVILCTGLGDALDREALKAEGFSDLLVKPLRVSELVSRVRDVLDYDTVSHA